MKKIYLIVAIFALAVQSCTVMKDVRVPYIVPDYHVSLKSVELPANAKERFGETITVDKSNGDSLRYTFEDDYIKISWFVGESRFYFSLFNKSDHSLKVVWDDATLVMPDNSISRLMHNGVKYDKRNESQVSTTIPKGAKIDDVLVPTENVSYEKREWQIAPLLPQDLVMEEAESLRGKTLKILLPIRIEDVQNEYTFVFDIDINPQTAYTTEKVHDVPNEIAADVFVGLSAVFFVFIFTKILGANN